MRNLFSVEGKVALVTGGSRGIGEMIARGYVENGAKVYISSRKANVCDGLAEELSKYGTCISLPFDLSNMDGITGLASALAEREDKLDILVNNAGATWGAPIDEYPEDGWDKTVDLNVKSIFFLTQKLLPQLRAAATHENPSRVINIASVNGVIPGMAQGIYSITKAAVISMTHAFAKECAPMKVRVNAILPGATDTKFASALTTNDAILKMVMAHTPMNRVADPSEMAGAALYLASDAASYTTGTCLNVDGGYLLA